MRGNSTVDRVTQLQRIVAGLVTQYAAEWKFRDGTKIEAVTDSEHGHFQIIRTGWKGPKFIHTCLVHLAIRDNQIQLLKNDTEVEWDRELTDLGVAPEEIVLVFRKSATTVEA